MADSFARILRLAQATRLAGIEAGSPYGTPSLKVAGKFMARLRDADTLVVRCPLAEKAFLLEAAPELFYETDHYKGYDAILLRLDVADDTTITGRIEVAWRMQAPKRRLEKRTLK